MKLEDFFYQLIAILSITDSLRESEPVKMIKSLLDSYGIKNYVIGKNGKKNLIAEIGKGKKSVILNSHFDVVPASDKMFIPRIEKGKVYARGTADAKGSLSAMISAFISLQKENLPGKVIMCCVCDEENAGEKGTNILVEKGISGDFVIVGEPTNLAIVRAEKGFLRLKIEIIGQEHHGAFPERNNNAISLAAKVITALESLKFKDIHALLSQSTINFGLIHGGNKINIGAGSCEIGIDIRYLPNQSEENIIKKIDNVLSTICVYELNIINSGIPFETSAESKLVSIAQSVTHSKILGVNFGTDGRFYSSSEVIVLGPGESEVAHKENEYIMMKDIVRAENIYKEIVVSCLQEGGR